LAPNPYSPDSPPILAAAGNALEDARTPESGGSGGTEQQDCLYVGITFITLPVMKVVIVGAGPSGLVTCKTLLEATTSDFPFDPVILEQEDNIGGTFRYRSYEVIEPQ
jgi:hypothetical protein